MARERARPIRRSSPLRFLPRMSNFRRDQMASKGLGAGALSFMSMAFGPDLFFFFFFFALSFFVRFDFFGMVEIRRRLEEKELSW